MQSIREHLDDGLVSSFRSFALFGTGGIGKTQTALSYAHEKSESGVDAVLWLNCETGLAISRSFFEIASLLQLDGVSEDESSDQNKFLVLKWLRKTGKSPAATIHPVGPEETSLANQQAISGELAHYYG